MGEAREQAADLHVLPCCRRVICTAISGGKRSSYPGCELEKAADAGHAAHSTELGRAIGREIGGNGGWRKSWAGSFISGGGRRDDNWHGPAYERVPRIAREALDTILNVTKRIAVVGWHASGPAVGSGAKSHGHRRVTVSGGHSTWGRERKLYRWQVLVQLPISLQCGSAEARATCEGIKGRRRAVAVLSIAHVPAVPPPTAMEMEVRIRATQHRCGALILRFIACRVNTDGAEETPWMADCSLRGWRVNISVSISNIALQTSALMICCIITISISICRSLLAKRLRETACLSR